MLTLKVALAVTGTSGNIAGLFRPQTTGLFHLGQQFIHRSYMSGGLSLLRPSCPSPPPAALCGFRPAATRAGFGGSLYSMT